MARSLWFGRRSPRLERGAESRRVRSRHRLATESLESRRLLARFTVTSAADDGEGTLRDAITQANATAGDDEIVFAIVDDTDQIVVDPTITLATALPDLTEAILIDGSSQPQSARVSLAAGTASGASGLTLLQAASGSTLVGLSLSGFVNGIHLQAADSVTILDCETTGNATGAGVLVEGGTDNLIVSLASTGNTNGISLVDAFDTQIQNSSLDGNTAAGLRVEGGESTLFATVVIPPELGSALNGTASASSNATGVEAIDTVGLTIEGVIVESNSATGIRLTRGSAASVVGSTIRSNAGGGIAVVGGSAHGIGGTTAGAANTIVSNTGDGISLSGGSAGVVIQRNFIGTDASLSTTIGNTLAGVRLADAIDTVVTYRNVIASNKQEGIVVAGGSGNRIGADETRPEEEQGQLFGNTVIGNGGLAGILVTTATGTVITANAVGVVGVGGAVRANTGDGIRVESSTATLVGGRLPVLTGDPNFGNVVAGNAKNGVALVANLPASLPDVTIVRGNTIRNNSLDGLRIENSELQLIGGNIDDSIPDVDETANTIISNGRDGIAIDGGSANGVAGNLVGTDRRGTAGLGNGRHGIAILGSTANAIGGDAAAGEGNLIAGNKSDGIRITTIGSTGGGSAYGNVVYGNAIDGNSGSGITIEAATGNRVGSATSGEGNTITANLGNGVSIVASASGTGADGNTVQGNLIGTDAAGSTTLGNDGAGIFIRGSTGNLVGGVVVGEGNLIARNAVGVRIDSALASIASANRLHGNTVQNNVAEGVRVTSSRFTFIGGSAEGEGNAIWLNGADGILLDGVADGVHILGNQVGTDLEGNDLGNRGDGIQIGLANARVTANVVQANVVGMNDGAGLRLVNASGTSVGGADTADGNVFSANGARGIVAETGSSANSIVGNTVSDNAGGGILLDRSAANVLRGNTVAENAGTGIAISRGTDNVLGGSGATDGNTIAGNASHGIAIEAQSDRNAVSGNVVDDNGGDGIVVVSSIGNRIDGGAVVTRNAARGIVLSGVTRGTVIGDVFVGTNADEENLGNALGGILVSGAVGNAFSAAVVANNGGHGIEITGATAATIAGGNVVTGSTILANAGTGIRVSGGGRHTIGTPMAPNVIADNGSHGVALAGRSLGNLLQSNLIASNNGDGILVEGGLGNAITAGNTITLNAGDGIRLFAGAANNLIDANFIGTDADGTADLGNAGDGVEINTGLTNILSGNTIADHSAAGARGIAIIGSRARLPLQSVSQAQGKAVRGNLVVSNSIAGNFLGIEIASSDYQTVGDSSLRLTAPGSTANTITGSLSHGVLISSSTTTVLAGNFIGTDSTGDEFSGNAGDGVRIVGSASSSVFANLVSQSGGHGVSISASSARSATQGNILASNTIRSNAGSGVRIGERSSFNSVGTAKAGNVIAENALDGVTVAGNSNANAILSNTISANGGIDEEFGPSGDGVRIVGSLGNTVRGGTIEDNVGAGVRIADALASSVAAGNKVLASRIEGNGGDGVRIEGGGRHTVGLAGSGNVILGNGFDDTLEDATGAGVAVVAGSDGRGSVGNLIRANLVGIDPLGTPLGNAGDGIRIEGGSLNEISTGNRIANNGEFLEGAGIRLVGSSSNTIGGTLAALGNAIESNASHGIAIESDGAAGSASNLVAGNRITANAGDGVAVVGGSSSGNVIGMRLSGRSVRGAGNSIAANGGAGVSIDGGVRNSILGNSLALNAIAIQLAGGGNADMPAPEIESVVSRPAGSRTRFTIAGSIAGAPARQTVLIELYASPAGSADEAAQLIGRVFVTTDASGSASFRTILTAAAPATSSITATATSVIGNTSAVSATASAFGSLGGGAW